MNLVLTPEIETSLVKKAERLGTTPEILALDLLRQQLQDEGQNGAHESSQNLLEFLGPLVGSLSSRSLGGDGRLSEDCGHKFAEGLLVKHHKTKS